MDERGTQPGGAQAPAGQQQQPRPLHSTAAHNADLPGIERLARLRTVPSQGTTHHVSGTRSATQAMVAASAAAGPTQMDIDVPSRSLPAPGQLTQQQQLGGGRNKNGPKSEVTLLPADHHPHHTHDVIAAGGYSLDMRQSMTFSSAGAPGSDLMMGLGSMTPTAASPLFNDHDLQHLNRHTSPGFGLAPSSPITDMLHTLTAHASSGGHQAQPGGIGATPAYLTSTMPLPGTSSEKLAAAYGGGGATPGSAPDLRSMAAEAQAGAFGGAPGLDSRASLLHGHPAGGDRDPFGSAGMQPAPARAARRSGAGPGGGAGGMQRLPSIGLDITPTGTGGTSTNTPLSTAAASSDATPRHKRPLLLQQQAVVALSPAMKRRAARGGVDPNTPQAIAADNLTHAPAPAPAAGPIITTAAGPMGMVTHTDAYLSPWGTAGHSTGGGGRDLPILDLDMGAAAHHDDHLGAVPQYHQQYQQYTMAPGQYMGRHGSTFSHPFHHNQPQHEEEELIPLVADAEALLRSMGVGRMETKGSDAMPHHHLPLTTRPTWDFTGSPGSGGLLAGTGSMLIKEESPRGSLYTGLGKLGGDSGSGGSARGAPRGMSATALHPHHEFLPGDGGAGSSGNHPSHGGVSAPSTPRDMPGLLQIPPELDPSTPTSGAVAFTSQGVLGGRAAYARAAGARGLPTRFSEAAAAHQHYQLAPHDAQQLSTGGAGAAAAAAASPRVPGFLAVAAAARAAGESRQTQNPRPAGGTSKFKGVTKHRHTQKFEAHLWDSDIPRKTKGKGGRTRGKQIYLGGFASEEEAARAYDRAALVYWGDKAKLNFEFSDYEHEREYLYSLTREEVQSMLRRGSSGFSRGVSRFRGVTRHHQAGKWEARIGRVDGSKYKYLGTFDSEKLAAVAYDYAALEYRLTGKISHVVGHSDPSAGSPATPAGASASAVGDGATHSGDGKSPTMAASGGSPSGGATRGGGGSGAGTGSGGSNSASPKVITNFPERGYFDPLTGNLLPREEVFRLSATWIEPQQGGGKGVTTTGAGGSAGGGAGAVAGDNSPRNAPSQGATQGGTSSPAQQQLQQQQGAQVQGAGRQQSVAGGTARLSSATSPRGGGVSGSATPAVHGAVMVPRVSATGSTGPSAGEAAGHPAIPAVTVKQESFIAAVPAIPAVQMVPVGAVHYAAGHDAGAAAAAAAAGSGGSGGGREDDDNMDSDTGEEGAVCLRSMNTDMPHSMAGLVVPGAPTASGRGGRRGYRHQQLLQEQLNMMRGPSGDMGASGMGGTGSSGGPDPAVVAQRRSRALHRLPTIEAHTGVAAAAAGAAAAAAVAGALGGILGGHFNLPGSGPPGAGGGGGSGADHFFSFGAGGSAAGGASASGLATTTSAGGMPGAGGAYGGNGSGGRVRGGSLHPRDPSPLPDDVLAAASGARDLAAGGSRGRELSVKELVTLQAAGLSHMLGSTGAHHPHSHQAGAMPAARPQQQHHHHQQVAAAGYGAGNAWAGRSHNAPLSHYHSSPHPFSGHQHHPSELTHAPGAQLPLPPLGAPLSPTRRLSLVSDNEQRSWDSSGLIDDLLSHPSNDSWLAHRMSWGGPLPVSPLRGTLGGAGHTTPAAEGGLPATGSVGPSRPDAQAPDNTPHQQLAGLHVSHPPGMGVPQGLLAVRTRPLDTPLAPRASAGPAGGSPFSSSAVPQVKQEGGDVGAPGSGVAATRGVGREGGGNPSSPTHAATEHQHQRGLSSSPPRESQRARQASPSTPRLFMGPQAGSSTPWNTPSAAHAQPVPMFNLLLSQSSTAAATAAEEGKAQGGEQA